MFKHEVQKFKLTSIGMRVYFGVGSGSMAGLKNLVIINVVQKGGNFVLLAVVIYLMIR